MVSVEGVTASDSLLSLPQLIAFQFGTFLHLNDKKLLNMLVKTQEMILRHNQLMVVGVGDLELICH